MVVKTTLSKCKFFVNSFLDYFRVLWRWKITYFAAYLKLGITRMDITDRMIEWTFSKGIFVDLNKCLNLDRDGEGEEKF